MANDTELLAEVVNLSDEEFSKRFLKIPTKPDPITGVVSLVPMVFNHVQSHFNQHKTKRNIVVKPRQMGMSTGKLASNYKKIWSAPHIKGMLIAHKDEATSMLLERVFTFYNNMPPIMQHKLSRESIKEIRFEELDSGMHIETAGAKVSGRSETLSFAHLSELAFWGENTSELLAGIGEAARFGEITIESTPCGNSGKFYDLYHEAKEGENNYKPFFYPWWWEKGYQLPRGSLEALERDRGVLEFKEDELMLINKYNLTEDQIRFRRWVQADLKELFIQEFPENDIDCWLAAGGNVFDLGGIRWQQMMNLQPPIMEDGPVRYYRLPSAGTYYISVDLGKGVPQGDFSVAQVIDVHRNEQVAVFRARMDGARFAARTGLLAKEYNNALIIPETNGGYAELFIKTLEDYPNMWHDPRTEKTGWVTTASNRNAMIGVLQKLIKDRDIIIHDDVTLTEISNFIDDGKKLGVPSGGGHDDTVMSLMIGLSMLTYHPVVQRRGKIVRYR